MTAHCASLAAVVRPGGTAHYVIGNSKFFDVLVPAERVLGDLLAAAGFVDVGVTAVRKRSSKKDLVEYVVSARKPP